MELTQWLASFAATGAIGPIRVGADIADIEETLGAPDGHATIHARRPWPMGMFYGDLELTVCRCRQVSMIAAPTWRDSVELPHAATGGRLRWPGRPAHSDIIAALNSIGCPWRSDPQEGIDTQCAIHTDPAGVGLSLTFATDLGAEPLLFKTNAHRLQAHDCPPATRVDRYSPDQH